MLCLLPTLRKEHHFEWKTHLGGFLFLAIPFLFAVICEAGLLAMLYEFVIYNFNPNGSENHSFSPMDDKFAEFWLAMTLLNITEIIPFFFFVLKNTLYPPHDCFVCFNKDPERRYSIYQYSHDEWT